MDIMIGIGISGLERENRSVGWCIQLNHRLHGQGAVDEIRGLIVHILHQDYHTLVVRILDAS